MTLIAISGKIGSGKDTVRKIINWLINKDQMSAPNEIADFETCLQNKSTYLEQPFENKKFADKLKDLVCLLIGCTREQLEDIEFKNKELGQEWNKYHIHNWGNPRNIFFNTKEEALEWLENPPNVNSQNSYTYVEEKITPRKLLQLIGTECGRDIIHPNIWVNSLFVDYVSVKVKDNLLDKKTKEASDKLWKIGHLRESNWIITDCRFPNEAQAIKDREGIIIRVNRPQLIERDFEHESETALDSYKDFDYIVDNNSTLNNLIGKIEKILQDQNMI